MFASSAYLYNHDLARLSLGMAATAFNTHDSDQYWAKDGADEFDTFDRDANVRAALDAMGFTGIRPVNYRVGLHSTDDKVAFTLANKHIEAADGSVVIAVIVRGGGYGGEWASNFRVGQGAYHIGFTKAADGVVQEVNRYVQSLQAQGDVEKIKFWVTGYSRGAAVSNLVVATLDRQAAERSEYESDDVYAYTFATPQGVYLGSGSDAGDTLYENIFNIVNNADLVPMVALLEWGFDRYGITYRLPKPFVTDGEDALLDAMTTASALEVYQPTSDMYTAITGGQDYYDAFSDHGQDVSLKYLIEIILDLIPSREVFVDDYEDVVFELVACLLSSAPGEDVVDGLYRRNGSEALQLLLETDYIVEGFRDAVIKIGTPIVMWLPEDIQNAFFSALAEDSKAIQMINVLCAICEMNDLSGDEFLSQILKGVNAQNIVRFVIALNAADGFSGLADVKLTHYPEVYMAWMLAHDATTLFAIHCDKELDNEIDTDMGSLAPESSARCIVQIIAGSWQSMVLFSDGDLYEWGGGKNRPTLVGTGYTAIAVGGYHSLALKGDALYAWGDNRFGQLGDGSTATTNTPILIGTGFSAISAGEWHSLALKEDVLYAWGLNDSGQIGDGTNGDWQDDGLYYINTPVMIGTGYTTISAGDSHSLALKGDVLFAWGYNAHGQLGDGTDGDLDNGTVNLKNTPTMIGTGYTAISAGFLHSLALKGDALYSWGDNSFGELGDGTEVGKNTPTLVGTGYTAIATGSRHSLALKGDELYAWGDNYHGAIGNGAYGIETIEAIPTLVGRGYTGISAGVGYSLALQEGTLYAWGRNDYGQLGDGTNMDRHTPNEIIFP